VTPPSLFSLITPRKKRSRWNKPHNPDGTNQMVRNPTLIRINKDAIHNWRNTLKIVGEEHPISKNGESKRKKLSTIL